MSVQTADTGGYAGTQSVPAGGPEAGAGGVTGGNTAGQPDQGAGQPKGKPGSDAAGGESSANVGLAKVFQGGPGAGAGGVTGGNTAGQPDQNAGQPKGNPRQTQSNDSVLPQWTSQLSKKLTGDPQSVAALGAFKTLDEFAQAFIDAKMEAEEGQNLIVPGKDSTPEESQAFYQRLGEPKEAAEYSFAKSDPAFAKLAFDMNLTKSQAEALQNAGLAQFEAARNAAKAAVAKDFQATDVLLQKEYGDKYGEAIALMGRGLGNDPKTGALSPVAKALVETGLAGKPEIVRAFIELGRATSEGTASGGSYRGPRPESITQGRGFSYKDDYSNK